MNTVFLGLWELVSASEGRYVHKKVASVVEGLPTLLRKEGRLQAGSPASAGV